MMRIKCGLTGCRIYGIQPELLMGLIIANDIYTRVQMDLVVTCVGDSNHMGSSLHYVGFAADLNLAGEKTNVVVQRLKENLGDDFDVVLEGDHIHMEFQPKRGVNLSA
jgi:hypothetical protein